MAEATPVAPSEHATTKTNQLKDTEVVPWNAKVEDASLVLTRKLGELANEEIEELVPAYTHVVAGRPHAQIVELARAYFCDLIVISTHGRTGVSQRSSAVWLSVSYAMPSVRCWW